MTAFIVALIMNLSPAPTASTPPWWRPPTPCANPFHQCIPPVIQPPRVPGNRHR